MSFKKEMLESYGLTNVLDFEGRKIDVYVQTQAECGDFRIRFTPTMAVELNSRVELHLPSPIRTPMGVYRMLVWNGEWHLESENEQTLPASFAFVKTQS
jgi:hypothetical protein